MRYDHQLRALSELIHHPQIPGNIDLVKGGIHFVQNIKRRRAAHKHGEQKSQSHQRPLAARQQRKPAYLLVGRLRADLHACFQQIVGVREQQLARAAREQLLEQRRKSFRHIFKSQQELVGYFGVGCADDIAKLVAGSSDVADLRLQEFFALFECAIFLKGQRIDGADDAKLLVQLLGPDCCRNAFGQLGLFHLHCLARFQVHVSAQTGCGVLQPHGCFGVFVAEAQRLSPVLG